MSDWLSNRSTVEKRIVGAIKSAIHAHGPVTEANVSSAAKRVYAALKQLRSEVMREKMPLKCDVCGSFVSVDDVASGKATHELLTPDSHVSREEYETLCHKHKDTP